MSFYIQVSGFGTNVIYKVSHTTSMSKIISSFNDKTASSVMLSTYRVERNGTVIRGTDTVGSLGLVPNDLIVAN